MPYELGATVTSVGTALLLQGAPKTGEDFSPGEQLLTNIQTSLTNNQTTRKEENLNEKTSSSGAIFPVRPRAPRSTRANRVGNGVPFRALQYIAYSYTVFEQVVLGSGDTMTNRDWFCLALRVFGLWLLIKSIEDLVPYLFWLVLDPNNAGQVFSYLAFTTIWLIARLMGGLVLLFFAPAIAARFYPSEGTHTTSHVEDEAKPLKVGIQLLAVYALLLAVQSVAGVIVGYLSGDTFGGIASGGFGGVRTGYTASLLTFGLNLAFGLALILWNERLVLFLAKMRYVPDRDAYESPPGDE